MKVWLKNSVAAAAIVAALGGCSQNAGESEKTGVVLGAIAGGLAGLALGGSGTEQVLWTVVGAGGGALIGGWIGRELDERDQEQHYAAREQATSAPVGQPVTWNNPDTGASGSVTATRETTNSSGQYCREFRETIVVDGQTREGTGLACRQPDGTWKIQEQAS